MISYIIISRFYYPLILNELNINNIEHRLSFKFDVYIFEI